MSLNRLNSSLQEKRHLVVIIVTVTKRKVTISETRNVIDVFMFIWVYLFSDKKFKKMHYVKRIILNLKNSNKKLNLNRSNPRLGLYTT